MLLDAGVDVHYRNKTGETDGYHEPRPVCGCEQRVCGHEQTAATAAGFDIYNNAVVAGNGDEQPDEKQLNWQTKEEK